MVPSWSATLAALPPGVLPHPVMRMEWELGSRATVGSNADHRPHTLPLGDLARPALPLLRTSLNAAPHRCCVVDADGAIVLAAAAPPAFAADRLGDTGARYSLDLDTPLGRALAGPAYVFIDGDVDVGAAGLIAPLAGAGTCHGALALALAGPCDPPTVSAVALSALSIAAAADAWSARRERERAMATVGHELRQPLSALIFAIETLGRADGSVSPAAFRAARRQTHYLAQLAEHLLESAHVASGKPLQPRAIDLRHIVTDAVHNVQAEFAERRQRVTIVAPSRSYWCFGDLVRLRQVAVNLLGNASRYTPAGGAITVELRQEADAVVLAVADTGAGIHPDDRNRIFEPFVRSDTQVEGIGLGLAVSRAIVQQHGGTIAVESQGPGLGSTFTVRLPLVFSDQRRLLDAIRRTQSDTRELVERARRLRSQSGPLHRQRGA